MDFDRIINNVTRHIALNQEEIIFFTGLFTARTLKPKEFLLLTDDTCRQMSFVDEGCLKVFHLDDKGIEHIVKFAPEDWWAVDIESFALQHPAVEQG